MKALLADEPAQVALMPPANEQYFGAPSPQLLGKGKAPHDMAGANLDRRVGANGYLHGTPASVWRQAANINSARVQSSRVSISCTRDLGRITGTEAREKVTSSLRKASARPQ